MKLKSSDKNISKSKKMSGKKKKISLKEKKNLSTISWKCKQMLKNSAKNTSNSNSKKNSSKKGKDSWKIEKTKISEKQHLIWCLKWRMSHCNAWSLVKKNISPNSTVDLSTKHWLSKAISNIKKDLKPPWTIEPETGWRTKISAIQ